MAQIFHGRCEHVALAHPCVERRDGGRIDGAGWARWFSIHALMAFIST
jgi:hypothetical protein